MKKSVKKILIGLAIIVGIIVLFTGYFGLRFYLGTHEMTPSETTRINDSVFCVKDDFVDAYLFKGKQGYVMSDAGISETSMKTGLDKLGITPDQVNTILLTHTDGDHIGALGIYKNARIFMHKAEEQMINGENGKFFFIRTKWKFGPYALLNSNDTMTVDGLKVKVFHTPGHTPGSCCFLIGSDYLLTGDNLAYKKGRFEHFNSFFNMDTDAQVISIRSLPDLKSIKYILTAHYGIVKN
ncbi:MAG: MBL fold metallo-hydrolase [Bacteroidales bacterium]|jgi:glyoxylase-like metal-dependent hydrolase (beta-lactamase superfamily II)|nr:MBL fold metallo-hydrolase [Bacteroidales bacterium]